MLKRLALAAMLCLGAGSAWAQSQPGWVSASQHPGVGKVVTADQLNTEFGLKTDTTGGTLLNGTITSSTLFNSILTGTTTAPTQAAGSNDANVATDKYVDGAVGTAVATSKSWALQVDTLSCATVTVGASETLNFSSYGDACYDLTLSAANPSLVVGPTNTGIGQRIHVVLSEPLATGYSWSAPTSSADVVLTDPAFTASSAPNSTTTFDIVSYGDNRVFVPAGKTYGGTAALTYASSLSLDTPAETIPGAAVTLTGTVAGGVPTALDFSTNNFASSTLISAPTFNGNSFSIQVGGLVAGSYTLSLRDHNNPTATASTGTFLVSPWTPQNLTTSTGAFAVYTTDPGNPSLAQTGSSGNLLTLYNAVNSAQYMLPQSGSTGNQVQVARGQGADGKRRLVAFHPAQTVAGTGDPGANWLTCGNLISSGGYCGSALLSLANSLNNATAGSYTVIIGEDVDTAAADGLAGENGFSWGTLGVPGPLSSVANKYNVAANTLSETINDASGGLTNVPTAATPGYHVITMIKNGSQITYRQDGIQIATGTVTATGATTFNGINGDFTLGGAFVAGQAAEIGLPPPHMGDFQAYSGVLGGTDLANAETMVGNSVGLSLSPVVPSTIAVATSITVGTIQAANANATITVPFSYTGNPQAVAYSVNGGSYTPVNATFNYNIAANSGTGTFTLPSGLAAGTYTIAVRDLNATTVSNVSAAFAVTNPITYAGTISVAAPTGVVPNSPFQVSATYSGGNGPPQAIQIAYDSSGSFAPVSSPTITGGISGSISFTTATGLIAGSHTIQLRDPNNQSSVGSSLAFNVAAPTIGTSATKLVLYSPTPCPPAGAVTFTGTYQGSPTQLDYQLTPAGGTAQGWAVGTNETFTNGTFSLTMPSGNASTLGVDTLQVRDHYTQSVVASATFYVTYWSETALATSPGASAVWSFNASDQTQVPLGSDGYIDQVNNAIITSQYLTPSFASTSTQRLLQINGSGNDSTHRAIGMSLVFGSDYASGDRAGNWLSAKAGGGSTLLGMANTSNVSSSSSWTLIEAGDMNTGLAVANIFAWGTAGTSPQFAMLQYLSSTGSVSAQIRDSAATTVTAGGSTSNGWHVYSVIKSGNTLILRIDMKQVATASITSTAGFTASDFTIGAGFIASGTNPLAEYGGALSQISGFDAFSGVLQGTDLTNAEEKMGSTAGLHF